MKTERANWILMKTVLMVYSRTHARTHPPQHTQKKPTCEVWHDGTAWCVHKVCAYLLIYCACPVVTPQQSPPPLETARIQRVAHAL